MYVALYVHVHLNPSVYQVKMLTLSVLAWPAEVTHLVEHASREQIECRGFESVHFSSSCVVVLCNC